MSVANWTEADSNRAREIWSDYLKDHDLSAKVGQTAGIDPVSRRIWFGDSIQDVVGQRDSQGIGAPLFFVRVGSATYYRKGAHRLFSGRWADGMRSSDIRRWERDLNRYAHVAGPSASDRFSCPDRRNREGQAIAVIRAIDLADAGRALPEIGR
jgi:hypothetical protein